MEQEKAYPIAENCDGQNGNCSYPFGATTIGLIYVNPGGFLGDYINLESSARAINQTFGFMSMNAEETVALIGGGHSFGKTHGACMIDQSKFLPPNEDPSNPWPIDICSNGTFTTGFEGYWTSKPSKWSNEYFGRLVNQLFVPVVAPGGQWQYQAKTPHGPFMMLPTDISLTRDPVYSSLVQAFAKNQTYLTEVFGAAWSASFYLVFCVLIIPLFFLRYKLTTRDMGPITRCLNVSINGQYQLPPPQQFQFPIPPAAQPLPDFKQVS